MATLNNSLKNQNCCFASAYPFHFIGMITDMPHAFRNHLALVQSRYNYGIQTFAAPCKSSVSFTFLCDDL